MKIVLLAFDGFNEIDVFVPFNILNRVKTEHWEVTITSPEPSVTSMNGISLSPQSSLDELVDADAVLIGSSSRTTTVIEDKAFMEQITLNRERQLIAAQCSGSIILHQLGLLGNIPISVDRRTRTFFADKQEVDLVDKPFVMHGNIATAGGCLASPFLAGWVISRLAGFDQTEIALRSVAPIGREESYLKSIFEEF